MNTYRQRNIERQIEDFKQQVASRSVERRQELLEAVAYGLHYPRKRRSLLQVAATEVLRGVVSTLTLLLEDLSEADKDVYQNTEIVDVPYTVVEPEVPIAAKFSVRKEHRYGKTHPQQEQPRPRPHVARPRTSDGAHGASYSMDELRDSGDE